MVTRCKMTCIARKENVDWPGQRQFTFVPVYDANPESENGKFFSATPTGQLDIGCVNPDVNFEQGKEYYIDIVPAN